MRLVFIEEPSAKLWAKGQKPAAQPPQAGVSLHSTRWKLREAAGSKGGRPAGQPAQGAQLAAVRETPVSMTRVRGCGGVPRPSAVAWPFAGGW